MGDKNSITSKFIIFLSKILFLPVTFSNEEATYTFFHWRTICHLIFYVGLRALAYWPVESTDTIKDSLDTEKKRDFLLDKGIIITSRQGGGGVWFSKSQLSIITLNFYFFCSKCPKNLFQTLNFFNCRGIGGPLGPWEAP